MNLFDLVHYIYLAGGTTTKSDFAREYATTLGEAASIGLITTETPLDGFGNVWRVTPFGLQGLFAWKLDDCPECDLEGFIEGQYNVLSTPAN